MKPYKEVGKQLDKRKTELLKELELINSRIDGEILLEDIWNELGPYSNAISKDLRYRLQDYFGFNDSE